MKDKVLELLSDGIMHEDWEYVKEAYKIVKGYKPPKEKIRLSSNEQQREKQVLSSVLAKDELPKTAGRVNAYGTPVKFVDDGSAKELVEVDKSNWEKITPTQRRPEQRKITRSCIKCDREFEMYPREHDSRVSIDENEKFGVLCNGCMNAK